MSVTDQRIEEIRERWAGDPVYFAVHKDQVAHAPADLADLLAEVDRLQAEIGEMVRVLAVATDTARREGFVPVADYDCRERQWRVYESELVKNHKAAQLENERLRKIADAADAVDRIRYDPTGLEALYARNGLEVALDAWRADQ